MTPELFLKSLERAYIYKIIAIETIERIAVLYLSLGIKETLPLVEAEEEGIQLRYPYRYRPTGCGTVID
jgi:hypothetical protein